MKHNLKNAALVLPLLFAVTARGNPESDQESRTEEATLEQPGFEGRPATPEQAQSEASELASNIASGDLDVNETRLALNDLGELINQNIDDFPADSREQLMEDLQSARDAYEANDMAGVQEVAVQIERKLSSGAPAADAE